MQGRTDGTQRGKADPWSSCRVIVLEGDDAAAQEDIAARSTEALGLQCLVLLAEDIPSAG
jgi:ferredoxin